MEREEVRKYEEAGEVLKEARQKARKISTPGTNLGDVAEEVEELISEKGLKQAFPVNLSINEEAAHYSPGPSCDRVFKEKDVLKVDIGVQSEGYIADSAITINPSGKYEDMIEANREVLEKALEFIEPGVTVGELGTFIQGQVPGKYSVVRNLTGHSLGRYEQHAGVSIPNFSSSDTTTIEKGDAVAIEPFLSTGAGKIKEGKKGNIYLHQGGNVRGKKERKLLKRIKEFNGMPFSSRWLDLDARGRMALKKLVQSGAVKHYPILRELDKGVVTQMEHTVLVGVDDGENVVTTR